MTTLREELAAICARAEPGLGASRLEVAAVRTRLEEPALRLAVAGRLKAGKSTLVNALLGQHLAATDATECTMVVTWYRYHPCNRVEVHLRDGSTWIIPAADDGGLPASLGCPVGDVARVVLEAGNERLRHSHVIIDTPGMDSLSHLDEDSLAAIAEADALLYVMPLPTGNDLEVLAGVRAALAGSRMSAANVIGVLSRIDELGSGGAPWETAPGIAAGYATRLRGLVGTVIPLLGKLAETVSAGRYSDPDTQLLRALADADPAASRKGMYSPGQFLGWADAPVDRPGRERLLDMLGMYGLREAIATIRTGQRTTPAIREHLRRQSGLDGLLAAIQDNVTRPADRLRADIALSQLKRVVPSSERGLTAELGEFRKRPAMRQTALVDALIELSQGHYHLEPDDAAALIALATGGDPASLLRLPPGTPPSEIADRAKDEHKRWKILDAQSHSGALQDHAHSAMEVCLALYLAACQEAPQENRPA